GLVRRDTVPGVRRPGAARDGRLRQLSRLRLVLPALSIELLRRSAVRSRADSEVVARRHVYRGCGALRSDLLYSRFITMALHDLGHLPVEEPFSRFRAHGLLTKHGGKMSKSHGNVVNPDAYFDRLGADTLRMYLVFLGPYDRGGEFSDTGIGGVRRFLGRVWDLV